MKRTIILIFFLIYSYSTVYSQVIRGTILDKFTKSPIDYALIYFNGTFVGTQSDKKGHFNLNISKNITMPLTISALGYYSHTMTDFLRDTSILIYLTPKVFELNEIVVTASAKEAAIAKETRKTNIKLFKREFLGATLNAQKCKINNESDIILRFDADSETLKAFATKPIIIDNQALGYKITFYLDKFEYSKKINSIIIIGNIIFKEDLTSSKVQKQRFERRRKTAYLGSKMHFFRTLWEDKLDSSGFKVKNKYNQRLDYFEFVTFKDSVTKFLKFQYYNPLYVTYYSKSGGSILLKLYDYVFFDKNGYYDGNGLNFDGEMAKQRIADLLPYEYYIKSNNR